MELNRSTSALFWRVKESLAFARYFVNNGDISGQVKMATGRLHEFHDLNIKWSSSDAESGCSRFHLTRHQ
jgi:hypothetical protein